MDGLGDRDCRKASRIFENLDDLSIDFAEYVSEISEISVKERGVFTIAITGGLLINLLRKLCEAPYNKIVDWTKWYVFWADERAVAKNHRDSNYKLTKDEFISQVPILSSHVYSINDTKTVDEAARSYEFTIRQLVKLRTIDVSESNDCPKFDLILLTLGSDGHIASLFPNHPSLEQKEDWVTYITDSPVSPPERITFTLPVINAALNVAIVAVGEDKAEAVKMALEEEEEKGKEGKECLVPAGMVMPYEGKLVWFLDKLAASKLRRCDGDGYDSC